MLHCKLTIYLILSVHCISTRTLQNNLAVDVDLTGNRLDYGLGSAVSVGGLGRHSAGAAVVGKGSVTGGNRLTFSSPDVGAGVGYRYNAPSGASAGIGLGHHQQSLGHG